jgi:lysyl-tRNA synthetase, class II
MTDHPIETLDENAQIQVRKEKLATLTAQHTIAYPNDFKPKHFSSECHRDYAHYDKAALEALEQKPRVSVAGRIMLRRVMGKASFITLQDMTGQIQAS